jgi:hypothetical protein
MIDSSNSSLNCLIIQRYDLWHQSPVPSGKYPYICRNPRNLVITGLKTIVTLKNCLGAFCIVTRLLCESWVWKVTKGRGMMVELVGAMQLGNETY